MLSDPSGSFFVLFPVPPNVSAVPVCFLLTLSSPSDSTAFASGAASCTNVRDGPSFTSYLSATSSHHDLPSVALPLFVYADLCFLLEQAGLGIICCHIFKCLYPSVLFSD